MNRKVLVAEVDETGRVICVWVSQPRWKSPRPVKPGAAALGNLTEYETSGAPRDRIEAWIRDGR